MATKAYWSWIAAGRPWDPARPVSELEAWCLANGFTVLGTIGDSGHLTADPPEDHTPFSATAWPVMLPGYIVCAIDIADERGLGEAILAGARAGLYPWLKYINVGQRHYHCRDGFQSSVYNSDTHNHLSIRSDWIDRSIGDFNPFGDDMTPEQERSLLGIELTLGSFIQGMDKTIPLTGADGMQRQYPIIPNQRLARIETELAAVKAAVAALSTGGVDIAALAEATAEAVGDREAEAARAAADVLDGKD